MNVQVRLSYSLLTAAAIALAPADGRAEGTPVVFLDLSADRADLDAYPWRNRPVLLFAPSPDDPDYVEQCAALHAATEGLLERDVVVLSDTDPGGGGGLRLLFGVQGFEVLLVGKDGGVKLRSRQPIAAEAPFAEIDAMPMRRREL